MTKALNEAIKLSGNQSALADAIGVKPPMITQWLKGIRPIPAKRAIQIEKLTGISRKDLCPQVFDGE